MMPSAPPSAQQKTVTFRNPETGLVLDAIQGKITLQHFNNSPSQLWVLESLGDGRFFIINMMQGYALDVQGTDVLTYPRCGSLNQQWFINSDKTIGNAAGTNDDLVLDVFEGDLVAGNKIMLYEKHGESNQLFDVQMIY